MGDDPDKLDSAPERARPGTPTGSGSEPGDDRLTGDDEKNRE